MFGKKKGLIYEDTGILEGSLCIDSAKLSPELSTHTVAEIKMIKLDLEGNNSFLGYMK